MEQRLIAGAIVLAGVLCGSAIGAAVYLRPSEIDACISAAQHLDDLDQKLVEAFDTPETAGMFKIRPIGIGPNNRRTEIFNVCLSGPRTLPSLLSP